jgi:hypothetical protein
MSFESASALGQVIGFLCSILWLALPITAVVSIVRCRRYGLNSKVWFPYLVLVGWILTVVLCVVSLLNGAWYGENGPSPQMADIVGLGLLLALIAIHFALTRI